MANGDGIGKITQEVDLYAEIEKRKDWFFECQLRPLNFESFRDVQENDLNAKSLLDLVSEVDNSPPPLGSRPIKNARVYIDSRKPVWTREERDQRNAFREISTGATGNWLNYTSPKKLVEKLAGLKKIFEEEKYDSVVLKNKESEAYHQFGRRNAVEDQSLPFAISRMFIIQTKPWLIPELFNLKPNREDCSDLKNWTENAENFIKSFENEVLAVTGSPVNNTDEVLEQTEENTYSILIKGLWDTWEKTDASTAVKVRFWKEPKPCGKYNFSPHINIKGDGYKATDALPFVNLVKYWLPCFEGPIEEVNLNSANSDMGLCHIIRTLYLYGTLPEGMKPDEEIKINRKRVDDFDTFDKFFEDLAITITEGDDKENLNIRFTKVKWKLKTLLKQSNNNPRRAAIGFSPIVQEIVKQAVLGYKFWLDEPFHAFDYYDGEDQDENKAEGINKARKDTGIGELFSEMEYWSENHYIMFASSEYLAGQLWPNEEFQPATDFLTVEDKKNKFGALSGMQRMERGKARVLKWLNNRLLFGWTEFNSSGYYREHLFALLNLVDFAGDEEVRKKAEIVTDLLLFDVTRFLHKGSMGACGGRSQFPSKNTGWDNAFGDLAEIMLGTRGVFIHRGGEIGCHFATTTYKTPAVLLEIGSSPPASSYVDRSRVSIGFDDAPKYGIQYSQNSDQKDSLQAGFAPKREKHLKALDNTNKAIEASHTGYEAWKDDTVFWWGQSAFYNKQVVSNTSACVDLFRLNKNKAFSLLRFIEPFGISFFEEIMTDKLSFFFEGSTRSRANIYTYRNQDIMLSSIQNFRTGQVNFQSNVNQATINTEINVFTTSGFPGLSISDFHLALGGALVGALGGSIVNTVLAGGTGGVITAYMSLFGFLTGIAFNENKLEGTDIGDQGDGVGWWTGYWSLPMVVQHENAAIILYDFNLLQKELTDIGSHVWLPRDGFDKLSDRRSSAYIDKNDIWNDLISTTPNIGRRGFWLFGNKIHKNNLLNPDEDEEGYIGVFSNENPAWQDKDSDFYKAQIEEKNESELKKIQDSINDKLYALYPDNQQRTDQQIVKMVKNRYHLNISDEELVKLVHEDAADLIQLIQDQNANCDFDELVKLYINRENHLLAWANPIPTDFFAGKDWYVDKKNIWIIQVGNKKEYGSFENFMERVSQAKIEVDDVGDMACTYHIPKPDGSSQVLSLEYKGEIKLDGAPFQDDFYPRFENPFIRGGRVEWGQREYVIEYRGKSLMHDFSKLENPDRQEDVQPAAGDALQIKGLVIYLKNEDQEMAIFTVATANVKVDSLAVAKDEVVAAGMVKENNFHDAEWIFFDFPATSRPDMTIDIGHHVIPGTDGDPDSEWKFTFKLMALMGDRSLKACTVRPIPLDTFYLRDKIRNTGPVPFSVQLSLWRSWNMFSFGYNQKLRPWQFAGQPGNDYFYFDYLDFLSIDQNSILWHQRHGLNGEPGNRIALTGQGDEPAMGAHFSLFSYSTRPDHLFLFLISEGTLYVRWLFPGNSWASQSWINPKITYRPMIRIPAFNIEVPDLKASPLPVPLGLSSRVQAAFINYAEIMPAVYLSGADGNFYATSNWPLDTAFNWRQIETASVFTLLQKVPFQVGGNSIIAMDNKRFLWQYPITPGKEDTLGNWEQLPIPRFFIRSFTIAAYDDQLQVLAVTSEGKIWSISLTPGAGYSQWIRVGQDMDFRTDPDAQLSCTSAITGRLDIFAPGAGDKLFTTWWTEQTGWENGHNWVVVNPDNHIFEISGNGALKAISRVNGQIEVFATDSAQNIWKNWWS